MNDKAAANPDLNRLNELRSEVEGRLLQNGDYRTLLALDRAIAEIAGATSLPPPTVNGASFPLPPPFKPKPLPVDIKELTQPDAAFTLLTQVLHEPAAINRLVTALDAHGIHVGGTNPSINLSSVLSKDGRFRSVRFNDRACWWVKGTPYPGELDQH